MRSQGCSCCCLLYSISSVLLIFSQTSVSQESRLFNVNTTLRPEGDVRTIEEQRASDDGHITDLKVALGGRGSTFSAEEVGHRLGKKQFAVQDGMSRNNPLEGSSLGLQTFGDGTREDHFRVGSILGSRVQSPEHSSGASVFSHEILRRALRERHSHHAERSRRIKEAHSSEKGPHIAETSETSEKEAHSSEKEAHSSETSETLEKEAHSSEEEPHPSETSEKEAHSSEKGGVPRHSVHGRAGGKEGADGTQEDERGSEPSSGKLATHEEASGDEPQGRVEGLQTSTSCGARLQVPKVALLFLTKGEMPHEAVWAQWIREAEGLVPVASLTDPDCGDNMDRREDVGELEDAGCECHLEHTKHAIASCKEELEVGNVLEKQFLFSVYIHPQPEFEGFAPGSLFHGREVPDRIKANWGSHQLVDAERALLREALRDPLNQDFVLLSESCIPLYPPAVVYDQLMEEEQSRIDSCAERATLVEERYTPRMGPELEKGWRKSSQWKALVRKHAQMVIDDHKVYPLFEKHCYADDDPDLKRHRNCFSDEHYIATLLAVSGVQHETDCLGAMTHVSWRGWEAHPIEYYGINVTLDLLKGLRQPSEDVSPDGYCEDEAALQAAQTAFVDIRAWDVNGPCLAAPLPTTLDYFCPLIARKFHANATSALMQVGESLYRLRPAVAAV